MAENNNNEKQVQKLNVRDATRIQRFIEELYIINPFGNSIKCTVGQYINNVINNPGPDAEQMQAIRQYIADNEGSKISSDTTLSNKQKIKFYFFLIGPNGTYYNAVISIANIVLNTKTTVKGVPKTETCEITLGKVKDDSRLTILGIVTGLVVNGSNLRLYDMNGNLLLGRLPTNRYQEFIAVINFNPSGPQMRALEAQNAINPDVDVTPYLWNVGYDVRFNDVDYESLIHRINVLRENRASESNIIIPDNLIANQLAQNTEINNNNVIDVENAIDANNNNNNNNDFGNDDEFENNEPATNIELPKIVWDFYLFDNNRVVIVRDTLINYRLEEPVIQATQLLPLEQEPERYARPLRYIERGPAPVLGVFPTEVVVPPRSDMFEEQPAVQLLGEENRAIIEREIYQQPQPINPVPMVPVELPILTNEEVRLVMRTAQALYYGRYANANIELANEARAIMVRDNIIRFIEHLQQVNANNPNERQVDIQATVDNILNADINTITNSDALINLYTDPDRIIGYNRNDIVFRAIMNIIAYEGTNEMEPLYVYTNDQDIVLRTIQDIYNGNYVQELLTDAQIQNVERERLRMIAFNAANAFQQNIISGDDYNDIMRNNNYYPPDGVPNAFADPDFVFGNGPLPIVEVAQGLIAMQQNAANQAHRGYGTFVYKMALVASACAVLSAYGISWLFDYKPSLPTTIIGTIYNWVNSLTTPFGPTEQLLNDVVDRVKLNVQESRVLLPGRVPIKHGSDQISSAPSMSISISQALEQNTEIGSYLLARASLSYTQDPGVNRLHPNQLDHLTGPVTNQTLAYVANAMVPVPTTPLLETNQPSPIPQIGRPMASMQPTILRAPKTSRPLTTKLRGDSAPWIVNYNRNENLPTSTPISPSKSYTGSPSFSPSFSGSPTPTPTPTPTVSPKLKEELEKQPKSFGDYVDQGVNYLGSVVSRGVSYAGTVLGLGLSVASEVAYRGFQLTMAAATEGGKFALKSIGTVGGLLITGVVAVVGYLIFRKR